LVHRPSGTSWSPPAPPPQQLRFAARAVTLAGGRDLQLEFENDLALGSEKIGLGGSAAACVLAVRAARPQASDDEVLRLAAEAHRAEQGGQGSGADVAACTFGGVLEVRSRPPSLSVRRVGVPADLRLLLAFTGRSADTRALIASVRKEPSVIAAIDVACRQLIAALEAADRERALEAVRLGATAMDRLGVVTPELAQACALAASAGAAGKPSGAGGGDCAVVLAFGDAMADRAEAALKPHFPVFRVAPA
jgi:phosphomevalonate kinase